MVYISATLYILILIKYTEPYKTLYNPAQDSFPHWKAAVLPCVIFSFFIHMLGSGYDNLTFLEWAWTFSIMLESVAILPQLIVLRKYRLVENLTGKFIFFLGIYRIFYMLNWVHRARTQHLYRHQPLVYICGFIQTALYLDFFYQYSRISRLTRHCRSDRTTGNDDGDDETEGLLFESEREMVTRRSTTESLLTNADHSLSLLENLSSIPDGGDTQQRRRSPESL